MEQAKILLVDDEPNVLNLASLVLKGAGHSVITSKNGLEGLQAFSDAQDSISVLVTDVQMPLMGGIEMAKSIKSIKKDLKVIFISGFSPTEEISDLILEWDAQFVAKPFDLGHFKSAVLNALFSPLAT
jgi:two-component system, cell cycle sensor histidine kinase and response regulator CckA